MTKIDKKVLTDNTPLMDEYPEMDYIDVNELITDPRYQRNLSPGHAKTIADSFDPSVFQPLSVNRRSWENDRLVVIDGQHRVHAVRKVANERFHRVPIQILNLSSLQEETDAFLKVNTVKRNLNAFDKLEPHLIKNIPYAVFIWELIQETPELRLPFRGETFGANQGKVINNVITCVNALRLIYEKKIIEPNLKNGEVLRKTLLSMFPVWKDCKYNTSAFTVNGIANFIASYDGTRFYSQERMQETMETYSPLEIKKKADEFYPRKGGGKTGGDGESFSIAFIDCYNATTKNSKNKITNNNDEMVRWIDMNVNTVRKMKTDYLV